MDKIVEGVVFKKARFLRTTCKNCGKDLSLNQVKREKKWCRVECNVEFQVKQKNKRYKHKPNNHQDDLDDDPSWDAHKDSCWG